MSSSFDNPGDFRGSVLTQGSPVNNAGQLAGTIINNTYQGIAARAVSEPDLRAAEELLSRLPEAAVPAPAALPARSWMRVPRNPLFVGRQADLLALARIVKAGEVTAIGQIAAATGLGGIGKTQFAAEFVHCYGQFFAGGACWLNFTEAANVPGEVARCGGADGLALHDEFAALPQPEQIALVLAAWCSPLPRLVVFDNCEDPALLQQWRPPYGGSRVLLTSRRAQWPGTLGVQVRALGTLAPQESVALLRKHRPDLAADDPVLIAITVELGHLPLALHLAGSYLERYRYDPEGVPAAYLAELRRPDLLSHGSLTGGEHSPTGHELHVANTFALSYGRLDPADPTAALARSVLLRAACFAPGEPIPRPLLRASLGVDPNDTGSGQRAADALLRAVGLGLIEQREDGALVLHRLLAAFLRQLTGAELAASQTAVEQAVEDEAIRLNREGLPAPLTAWRLQLQFVAAAADARGAQAADWLLNELGRHLRMVADLAGARAAHERALAIAENTFGPNDPRVAVQVNNLGLVLRALGDLAGARAAYERALAIDEKTFGPDRPEVAIDINNLGAVLWALGDLVGARAAFERALAIDEKAFGRDHPRVANRVNNLGLVLRDLGDLAGARAAHERALAIDEKIFGPDHPEVAIDINNLGSALRALGDLVGARAAYERALAIDEKSFGPDHPEVATDVNNFGLVLQDLGDRAGARAAFERALRIFNATLPADHPNIQTVRNSLANLGGPGSS
jgi:tetratricopeptide (TPR) repeat protein